MDLSAKAQSRIYWQYKNADKVRQWVDTIPATAQPEIENPAAIVADILNIDERSGHQLDIIARIVGLERPPVDRQAEQSGVVSMAAADLAPQLGGQDSQLTSAAQTITGESSDQLLRVLIKAKIERNNGDATIDNVIDSARFIAGFDPVTVNDNQDMTWSLSFGQELDTTTRFAFNNFDILPRPDGTRFLGFIESPGFTQLGISFAQLGDERAQLNEVLI